MLKKGDVIRIKEGHQISARVPEHFVYSNREGSWELTDSIVTVEGPLLFLEGTYIVVKTATDGGGTGHGPGDIFPDGHHVFAEKVEEPKVRIDFYQTGSFINQIEDIDVIGKAKKEWVWDGVILSTDKKANSHV